MSAKQRYQELIEFVDARLSRDDAQRVKALVSSFLEEATEHFDGELRTLRDALNLPEAGRDPDGVDIGERFPVWLLWRQMDTGPFLAGIASSPVAAVRAQQYVGNVTGDRVYIEPMEVNHLFAQKLVEQAQRGKGSTGSTGSTGYVDFVLDATRQVAAVLRRRVGGRWL